MNNFKNIITNRRKELKMTQRELAEKLNVSDKIISKWETGVSYPDLTIINALSQVLDVSVSELLDAPELTKTIEPVSINQHMIHKYKMYFMISMGLLLLAVILTPLLGVTANLGKDNKIAFVLVVILMAISIISSVIIFTMNNMRFRSFYITQFYRMPYDKLYYRFNLILTDITWILPFSMAIYISSFNQNYLREIIVFVVFLLSLFLKLKIAKQSQHTYKNTTQLVMLLIVSLVSFVFMAMAMDSS